MKAKYEKASCDCGWFCLVLKEAKAIVYHCGKRLKKIGDGEQSV